MPRSSQKSPTLFQILPDLREKLRAALSGRTLISVAELCTLAGYSDTQPAVWRALNLVMEELGWKKSPSRMMNGVRGTFYTRHAPSPAVRTPAGVPAPSVHDLASEVSALNKRTDALARNVERFKARLEHEEGPTRDVRDVQLLISGILDTLEGWKWWFRSNNMKIPDNCRMPAREALIGKTLPPTPPPCRGCLALESRLSAIENLLRAAGVEIPTATTATTEPTETTPQTENAT